MEPCDYGSCDNNTFWAPEPRVSPIKLLGWNLSPEELKHIPEHWLSYPEPKPLYNYILGILYIGLTIVSLVGNGLVIWIFTSVRSLRTPSNVFVVNLAICDFLMMLKTPIFIYNSFKLGFALGNLGCQVFGTVGAFSGIGASATNAIIAYDRYRVIATPFAPKLTVGKALLYLLLIWIYVTPWALFPLFNQWSRYVPEGFLTSCTFDYLTQTDEIRSWVATMFAICYVIPLSLVIYFYSQMVSHVIIHEHNLREQAKKMNVESLRSNANMQQTSTEIRIAKAAITICFLFVTSWTPYAVLALIGAFGNQNLLTPGVTMIPACACKAVACIDPYVYAISHPKYRQELNKKFPWLEIKEAPPPSGDTTSAATEMTNTPSA
ncbi:opsin, ultraviolet-sensitive [Cimex lectularius]|uniref:G-protein coupled receptors family 1 profile domain-containing protein n=1 Tax=Cimex lectularius TaxID=79782 RepID=A0A8I6RC27_CIMLE|nr:opsin, ultraviolet-sensitive [Cimex lectularius]XP_024083078.1 opsin, ultraviolet-sensitive [Cimex lectularius]